ncbi:synaptonemal complex central element protein 2 isoform X1 [Agelaius phoeniceus]|uniref:synaptonemal complex central element protein 2 isoform X1 n=1 Tax=Agelaius phoeniceus TaxID=39638 RepID=UPI004054C5F4
MALMGQKCPSRFLHGFRAPHKRGPCPCGLHAPHRGPCPCVIRGPNGVLVQSQAPMGSLPLTQSQFLRHPRPQWGPCPRGLHALSPAPPEAPVFRPRPRAGPALGPRSSLLFASLDAAVEGLQQRVQDVLGRLNSGREEAHTELSGVRGSLLLKVSELAEQLEERLFHRYGFHNGLIQERLQALGEVLERVEEVQAELRRICCTVEAAYQELCLQPEA